MLVFDNLVIVTLCLSFLYFLLVLYTFKKLSSLHVLSLHLNLSKVFVMSCFLTSILRVMSFLSLSGFLLSDYNLKSSLNGEDDVSSITKKDNFFDKAMIVLFDFPDFSIISSYMLISLVWAESFLQVILTPPPSSSLSLCSCYFYLSDSFYFSLYL